VFHKGKIHAVRRVMRELQDIKTPQGYFLATTCGNYKCVNPAHIQARTAKAHSQEMLKQVDYKNPSRLLKLTERAQVRRKLTDEQLETIRCSNFSCRQLAEKFCVNQSLISRVRRGESHRMSWAKNNPFFRLLG
jgi:predicted XRE-type DNA-binding protein